MTTKIKERVVWSRGKGFKGKVPKWLETAMGGGLVGVRKAGTDREELWLRFPGRDEDRIDKGSVCLMTDGSLTLSTSTGAKT